ncbi:MULTISPECIES: hypothetical protein [unclassified Micromonospora]|uniref:hypothetical protein n=1 Tax=unclassified Micromonospora TaxID=2617518 RepID=UPI0033BAFB69
MLSSFLQTMATKMVEEILKRLVEWLAPKALRSVPHRATPNCPRCGGYGVARWAPGGVRAVFVLSLLAFTSTCGRPGRCSPAVAVSGYGRPGPPRSSCAARAAAPNTPPRPWPAADVEAISVPSRSKTIACICRTPPS